MKTTAELSLETERELREHAEKNYRDLLAFLRGEPPATYCLHVRGHADEIAKLHGDALNVAAQNADAAKMAEMKCDELRRALAALCDAVETRTACQRMGDHAHESAENLGWAVKQARGLMKS